MWLHIAHCLIRALYGLYGVMLPFASFLQPMSRLDFQIHGNITLKMFNFIAQVLTIWVVISPYEIHEHINMEVVFIFFRTYVHCPLMLSSSVVLQPLVLFASHVLHQLRHQPDPLQHHVLQVVGHLFLLRELDQLQDHKLDKSADIGSESGSEDFLAAAILLRDQPPTLNQQGCCSTNNQLKCFFLTFG